MNSTASGVISGDIFRTYFYMHSISMQEYFFLSEALIKDINYGKVWVL